MGRKGVSEIDGRAGTFVDLPALLVEEVLEKASDVGNELCENLRCLKEERAEYRQVLLDRGLILHESSFDYLPADHLRGRRFLCH